MRAVAPSRRRRCRGGGGGSLSLTGEVERSRQKREFQADIPAIRSGRHRRRRTRIVEGWTRRPDAAGGVQEQRRSKRRSSSVSEDSLVRAKRLKAGYNLEDQSSKGNLQGNLLVPLLDSASA